MKKQVQILFWAALVMSPLFLADCTDKPAEQDKSATDDLGDGKVKLTQVKVVVADTTVDDLALDAACPTDETGCYCLANANVTTQQIQYCVESTTGSDVSGVTVTFILNGQNFPDPTPRTATGSQAAGPFDDATTVQGSSTVTSLGYRIFVNGNLDGSGTLNLCSNCN